MSVVREALLYSRVDDKVRCMLCGRGCIILDGERGFCGTRENRGGKLYTLVYGDISAVESRPIEIKPFFHFHPGSTALTFSTWSCNLSCPWCQNFHLSKTQPDPSRSNYIPVEMMIEMAMDDDGICVSFQEPTMLFEYCLDCFRLAKEKGLYTCIVSNGFMSEDALRMMIDAGLDAIKIDVKGDSEVYERYCGGDVRKVWRNARIAKELGAHVEIVNLLVTGVSDREESIMDVIQNHLKHVGEDVPIHFTRYFPAYEFTSPPTKVEILERAYNLSKREGILYPYLGNVYGHKFENTYCPRCGELIIERLGCRIVKMVRGDCPRCGEHIPIIW